MNDEKKISFEDLILRYLIEIILERKNTSWLYVAVLYKS